MLELKYWPSLQLSKAVEISHCHSPAYFHKLYGEGGFFLITCLKPNHGLPLSASLGTTGGWMTSVVPWTVG